MCIKIAILGLGTVGYGVYDIINKVPLLQNIKVVKILDKDFSKQELVNNIITDNYDDIINDKSISIVVETMGAGNFSYQCIKKALLASKHVVTANKEVVASHIEELTEIKSQKGVSFYYEASVGGGIPIIKQTHVASIVNQISEIKGILNGTTNYILSKMTNEKLSFANALKLAQEAGFAEADPTADLEGLDMVRKISILSDIAYQTNINIDKVWHFGIKNVSDIDITYADNLGYAIKFVASSSLVGENISISVEPKFVSKDSIIAKTSNEFNVVEIKCDYNDDLLFYGKGAGRYPTANAIVNDIIMIVNNDMNYTFKNRNTYRINELEESGKYYLRVKDKSLVEDKLIDKAIDNQILTKEVSFEEIKKQMENIIFYAKVVM